MLRETSSVRSEGPLPSPSLHPNPQTDEGVLESVPLGSRQRLLGVVRCGPRRDLELWGY